MQQRRRSSHLCPSGLTWLCTPLLVLAALLAIPAGEPVSNRTGQLIASPRLNPLRYCQTLLANTLTVQQVEGHVGACSEALPGVPPSADSPWSGAHLLPSRQVHPLLPTSAEARLRAETLPPSPHSAAHPAVFFALSPPIQGLFIFCFC